MQNRVGRVAECADANERHTGQHKHDGQYGDAHLEAGNLVGDVRLADGDVSVRPHDAVGGDELRYGEVRDDDDADTAQDEGGVEHARSKGRTVAELREIVAEPVGIGRRGTCGAHAGNHKEGQERRKRLGVHQLGLYKRQIPAHASEGGGQCGDVRREDRLAHDRIHEGEHHIRHEEQCGRIDDGEREDLKGAAHSVYPPFLHVEQAHAVDVADNERDYAASCNNRGACHEPALRQLPERGGQLQIQKHAATPDKAQQTKDMSPNDSAR